MKINLLRTIAIVFFVMGAGPYAFAENIKTLECNDLFIMPEPGCAQCEEYIIEVMYEKGIMSPADFDQERGIFVSEAKGALSQFNPDQYKIENSSLYTFIRHEPDENGNLHNIHGSFYVTTTDKNSAYSIIKSLEKLSNFKVGIRVSKKHPCIVVNQTQPVKDE